MKTRAEFLGHPIHQMVIVLPLGLLATAATRSGEVVISPPEGIQKFIERSDVGAVHGSCFDWRKLADF